MTELLLALIAALLALMAIWMVRKDNRPVVNFYEDEGANAELIRTLRMIQTPLINASDVNIVKLPEDMHKTMARVQSAAVDVQGLIDLLARYLVLQMPYEAYKDLDPPEGWLKREGVER